MDVIWNKHRILNLLQYFYTLVQARVGFFDIDGKEILAYPLPYNEYCFLIRSTPEGNAACVRCDQSAYCHARESREPYAYRCHAGLTEMIAPIKAYGDRLLGYLMIGQLRSDAGDPQELNAVLHAVGLKKEDLSRLMEAYSALTYMDTDKIMACTHILQACAAYVWLDDYVHILNEPLSQQVENFISANLTKPLSLSEIAGQFGVSKTTLCQTVRRELHKSVNGIIRSARIKEAKRLLQSTNQAVAEISASVGILDYNYFSKVFKEETGISPSIFRRLCQADHLYHKAGQPAPIAPDEKIPPGI